MASKTLLAELQTALASYLDNHKNLSIQSISNKTGVSYSTIRRILQNEANDVRDETILSLILVVMPQAQRLQFLQTHYPALGALLKEAQSQAVEEPALDHFKLRMYRFKDPHNYILKMALTAHGTTRKDIFRILGERGVSALDEMLEDKFLFEDRNNKVSHPSRGSFIMNSDDILHQIKKDADYYDKSLVGSQFARLAHLSASLSLSAYKELIELVSEFAKKSDRLKEASQNQGAIPVFIDIMVNTYDRASLTGVS
jgi:hypothetical protein